MATKLENYIQMAGDTAAEITRNREKWTAFLATASRLYRYQFTDQLLIHAQRPQATACAEFDLWNKRMRRYIRRGSRGIGLVSVRNGRPSLRYVFDIADTGKRRDARELFLWRYKKEYDVAVTKHLEEYFGLQNKNGIIELFGLVATKSARGFWKKHGDDIIAGTAGSQLENLDEHTIRVKFCNIMACSVCYMILIRCGADSEKILSQDVFDSISDYNTTSMTKILGYAVSRAGDMILHQIAVAIFQYEREKKKRQHNGNLEKTDESRTGRQELQQTAKDVYNYYKPIIKEFLLNDAAYQNACRNSDQENAIIEGFEAVKRAVLSVRDLRFLKLYYDMRGFHERLQSDVIAETYPLLAVQDAEESGTEGLQGESAESTETPEAGTETASRMDEEPEATEQEQETVATDDTEPGPGAAEREENIATEPEITADSKPAIVLDESEVEELQPSRVISNYRIADDNLGNGGAKEKYSYNMYAIIMLKQIESENRPATLEEQNILSQYVGWGGLADAFDESKDAWAGEYRELKKMLSTEEYTSARESTLNAHYTSPVVIRNIYSVLERMGFKSGNILEPSCGIGNFFGMLPETMSNSKLYGVEIDSITGRIAKQLYPKANIRICGYEKTDFPANFFDVAVGNVPFGQYQINDLKYNDLKFAIHQFTTFCKNRNTNSSIHSII